MTNTDYIPTVWGQAFVAATNSQRTGIHIPHAYMDINDGYERDAKLFAQIVYWYLPNQKTGEKKVTIFRDGYYWIAKKHAEWYEEARVRHSTVRRVLDRLKKRGLIIYEVHGYSGEKTPWIRINWEEFQRRMDLWVRYETQFSEEPKDSKWEFYDLITHFAQKAQGGEGDQFAQKAQPLCAKSTAIVRKKLESNTETTTEITTETTIKDSAAATAAADVPFTNDIPDCSECGEQMRFERMASPDIQDQLLAAYYVCDQCKTGYFGADSFPVPDGPPPKFNEDDTVIVDRSHMGLPNIEGVLTGVVWWQYSSDEWAYMVESDDLPGQVVHFLESSLSYPAPSDSPTPPADVPPDGPPAVDEPEKPPGKSGSGQRNEYFDAVLELSFGATPGDKIREKKHGGRIGVLLQTLEGIDCDVGEYRAAVAHWRKGFPNGDVPKGSSTVIGMIDKYRASRKRQKPIDDERAAMLKRIEAQPEIARDPHDIYRKLAQESEHEQLQSSAAA